MIRKKHLLLCLTLLFMVFIFVQSSLPADLSQQESGPFSMFVMKLLPIDKDTASFLVRKCAHFTEYLLLGICLLLTLREWVSPPKSGLFLTLLAWGIGTFYALSDEFHQAFVPERSCELRDIIIDSLGVLTGIVIITLILRFRSRQKSSR